MCQRVECNRCGRPTFAGCGMHVEQVLGDVPQAERCCCRAAAHEPESQGAGRSATWLRELFGRRS